MPQYLHKSLNVFLEGGIYLILICSAIALGAVHRGSLLSVEALLLVMGLLYGLKAWEPPKTVGFLKAHSYLMPFGLFCLLVLFQSIPLPQALLQILSPGGPALYESIFFPAPTVWKTVSLYAFESQKSFLFIVSLVALFLLVLHFRPGSSSFEQRLFWVVIALGVAEASYGLGNYFFEVPYLLWFRSETPLINVTGTFVNRNHFAGYLVMVTPLCLAMWVRQMMSGSRRVVEAIQKGIFPLCLILLAMAVLFSHSRAGIVSFCVAMLFFVAFCRREILRNPFFWLLGIGGIALLGIALSLDKGLDIFKFRVTELLPWSEYFKMNRFIVWQGSLAVVKDFPFFGTGMGTFTHIYPAYSTEIIELRYVYAHSDWLQLLVEAGGVGFLLVLGSFVWFVLVSLNRLKRCGSPGRKVLGIGLLSGLIGISFQNLVEFNMHIPSNAILFTVLAGLVCRITHAFTQKAP